jgi:hypothetical protein
MARNPKKVLFPACVTHLLCLHELNFLPQEDHLNEEPKLADVCRNTMVLTDVSTELNLNQAHKQGLTGTM